ncbi:MAG: damage-inducible protein DinB [Chloroflexota bacterium]|nr:damage-inducible protein DinB [Chloroflexota bacterium]
MTTTLRELFRHNRWANEQILEACRALTDQQRATTVEGTYGELGNTLTHLVRAESFYLKLLTDWQPPVRWEIPGPFPGIDVLLERARFTGERLVEIADGIDPARAIDVDGDAVPAAVILVQAINHATEHRSHVATILTQLGVGPPEVDGWSLFNVAELRGTAPE